MEIRNLQQETVAQVMKAAPALGGGFWAAATSSHVVAAVTILYVVSQTAYLHWKWYNERKAKKSG